MDVHLCQKIFFLTVPVLEEALKGNLCSRHKINRTDLIFLIAANLFFGEDKFNTISLREKMKRWGYNYSLSLFQKRFNTLASAGFLECVRLQSYPAFNTKMPALYVITKTGKYILKDFSGRLKEAVRKLVRD